MSEVLEVNVRPKRTRWWTRNPVRKETEIGPTLQSLGEQNLNLTWKINVKMFIVDLFIIV